LEEDALLSATGFPPFSAFARQNAVYLAGLWGPQAPARPGSPAAPQPGSALLPHGGPFMHLPLATAPGWHNIWKQ
jgi:hypothetical protein